KRDGEEQGRAGGPEGPDLRAGRPGPPCRRVLVREVEDELVVVRGLVEALDQPGQEAFVPGDPIPDGVGVDPDAEPFRHGPTRYEISLPLRHSFDMFLAPVASARSGHDPEERS